MTPQDYLKFFVALLLVLGMIGGLAYILRRFGMGMNGAMVNDKRRLKIIEVLYIDARRKAVLLSRDDQEHLVILGSTTETLIEPNIKRGNEYDSKIDALFL